MVEGGYEEWELVPSGCRSGGLTHSEVAQGRGGGELATPRS